MPYNLLPELWVLGNSRLQSPTGSQEDAHKLCLLNETSHRHDVSLGSLTVQVTIVCMVHILCSSSPAGEKSGRRGSEVLDVAANPASTMTSMFGTSWLCSRSVELSPEL